GRVAEARARDRVGRDARRVVVGRPGHEARAEVGEEPPEAGREDGRGGSEVACPMVHAVVRGAEGDGGRRGAPSPPSGAEAMSHMITHGSPTPASSSLHAAGSCSRYSCYV